MSADTDPKIDPSPPPVAEPGSGKRGPGRPRSSGNWSDTSPKPEKSTAGRPPGRPSNIDKLADSLTAQFAGLAMLVFPFDPAIGTVLLEDAPAHGAALAELAKSNPKIRRLLEGGITGSAWVGVAVAFGSTGVKINGVMRQRAAERAEPAPAEAHGKP